MKNGVCEECERLAGSSDDATSMESPDVIDKNTITLETVFGATAHALKRTAPGFGTGLELDPVTTNVIDSCVLLDTTCADLIFENHSDDPPFKSCGRPLPPPARICGRGARELDMNYPAAKDDGVSCFTG